MSTSTVGYDDIFDIARPPNETPERIEAWNAAEPADYIPIGATYLEKWSNGHYGKPRSATFEVFGSGDDADFIGGGPVHSYERRIVSLAVGAKDAETVRKETDEKVRVEFVYRICTAFALGYARGNRIRVEPGAAEHEIHAAMDVILYAVGEQTQEVIRAIRSEIGYRIRTTMALGYAYARGQGEAPSRSQDEMRGEQIKNGMSSIRAILRGEA